MHRPPEHTKLRKIVSGSFSQRAVAVYEHFITELTEQVLRRRGDLRVVLQGDQPQILAPWFALAVLVIGFVSTFVTRARRSASTQLADPSKSTA